LLILVNFQSTRSGSLDQHPKTKPDPGEPNQCGSGSAALVKIQSEKYNTTFKCDLSTKINQKRLAKPEAGYVIGVQFHVQRQLKSAVSWYV
jgi:hypothetical protein